MPHELIELSGDRYASVGAEFKQKLNKLVQQFHVGSNNTRAASDVLKDISNHQYLRWDAEEAARHQWRCSHYNDLTELGRELSDKLAGDEITFLGLEGTTGQAKITPEKLKGRKVPLLDVAPKWLLVELERHPTGGSGTIMIQYWLYSQVGLTVELLRPAPTILPGKFDNLMTQRPDGQWYPTTGLRDSFFELVEKELGAEAGERIRKLTEFQPDLLCCPSIDILDQCKARTGVAYVDPHPRFTPPGSRGSLDISRGFKINLLPPEKRP